MLRFGHIGNGHLNSGADERSSIKQDHQRWGYSTVIHLEQPVYLAIWKDLNKEKRIEHRKTIEP